MVLVVSYPAPALFEQSLTKVLGKQMCYSLRLPLTLENINLSVDCFNFKSVATVEFIFTIHLRLSLRHFITLATGCGRGRFCGLSIEGWVCCRKGKVAEIAVEQAASQPRRHNRGNRIMSYCQRNNCSIKQCPEYRRGMLAVDKERDGGVGWNDAVLRTIWNLNTVRGVIVLLLLLLLF